MSFGQSTPADVERVFGAADERPPDGSLVYRTEDRRRRETESVTFRFEGGLIKDHHDEFDFTRWARQAIGVMGLLPPVRSAVRRRARAGLDEFIARGASS